MSRSMVVDLVPHNNSRFGHWLGIIFHPFAVFIPALVVVLKDTDALDAIEWIAFIAASILIPTVSLIALARRRGRYTYQREARHILYGTFWLSMVLCAFLSVVLDAPERLVFSLLTLCVWTPVQALINARLTKISAHTGVITGVLTAFFLMGDLHSPLLIGGAIAAIGATGWARVATGHHTLLQVSLGFVVSALSVFAAFLIIQTIT